jgi:hypothetical protein
MWRARLAQAKEDFARLLLGMFARTTPAFLVTYAYVGQAEAPQRKADVIDVTARLFVAADGLPIMLTWQAPIGPPGPGGPGAITRPGAPPSGGRHQSGRRAVRPPLIRPRPPP